MISTCLNPFSIAFFETDSAVIWAANAVLLREPLKPFTPEEDHVITSFLVFVMQIKVLLNVALMWTIPLENFLLKSIEDCLSSFFKSRHKYYYLALYIYQFIFSRENLCFLCNISLKFKSNCNFIYQV